MYVWPACVCLCMQCHGQQNSVGNPWDWMPGDCELLWGCWELNHCCVKEEPCSHVLSCRSSPGRTFMATGGYLRAGSVGSANSHVQILCRFIWFCVLLISALASLAIQSVLFHLQELFIWWSLWPLISSFIPLWSGKTQEMISLLLVYWPPLWVYFRQDSIPVENNVCSVFVRWKIL